MMARPRLATVWNAQVGDEIYVNEHFELVIAVTSHEPGHHVDNVRRDWIAVVVHTAGGRRTCGHDPAIVGSLVAGLTT